MRAIDHNGDPELEAAICQWGEGLWHSMEGAVPGLFERKHWQNRLLAWAMRDPAFKRDLFRFVDVLPALRTAGQISRHVRDYLLGEKQALPAMARILLRAAAGGPGSGLAALAIKKGVTRLARQFIAGADPRAALPALRRLHGQGLGFTADLLGEATLSEVEARVYQERYLALIDWLAEQVAHWPADEVIDHNHLGPIPRLNISLKISALDPQLNAVDPGGCVGRLKQRVLPILLRAREKEAFVNLDLEEWEFHQITYDLFEELLSHPEIKTWPHVGIVVQAYLRSAHQDLERLLFLARSRGAPIAVRLVKGAYWEREIVRARRHGYACPVFAHKADTDANYEELSATLLAHLDYLHPAFGSHNLRALSHAVVRAEQMDIPRGAYEIQMLYGMAEPERQALRARGHRVRIYAPVGALLPGVAYLIRRLLENTSNEGFLRLGFYEGKDVHQLLARPRRREKVAQRLRPGDPHSPFENCPLTDFTDEKARRAFARAIEALAAALPLRVPVVVEGVPRFAGPDFSRCCPSQTERPVAAVVAATPAEVDRAVQAAGRAWPEWRARPLEERALLLEKLAQRLRTQRLELAALQSFEVGKPWREADAEVAEAIDFCHYYARQALCELGPRCQDARPGEVNHLFYEGRGPAAVIAPWNFSLAILCGMAAAALVAGNTVVLKPAEQASAVAHALYRCMVEAGFPPGVVHFLPGRGEEVGARLVEHPDIAQIAFTGSKKVGLAILEKSARTLPGQRQVKRVVCEMGGKNAIVVDEDADLDEAVSGVVQSAFDYAGQKCSACSRALVVGAAYEPFARRLVEACRSLKIGPAHDPASQLGPVIDAEAERRLRRVIEQPGEGAVPLYRGRPPAGGFYVAPAVFAVQDAGHPLMREELFGPILAVARVECFAAALDMAGSGEFALTGSVYSRTPRHLQEARARFRVGNLYLNRGCTGALVQRQPFGGFGMSGTGTKAGGPGYLLNFADPRCVTENTVRGGFVPDMHSPYGVSTSVSPEKQ